MGRHSKRADDDWQYTLMDGRSTRESEMKRIILKVLGLAGYRYDHLRFLPRAKKDSKYILLQATPQPGVHPDERVLQFYHTIVAAFARVGKAYASASYIKHVHLPISPDGPAKAVIIAIPSKRDLRRLTRLLDNGS